MEACVPFSDMTALQTMNTGIMTPFSTYRLFFGTSKNIMAAITMGAAVDLQDSAPKILMNLYILIF